MRKSLLLLSALLLVTTAAMARRDTTVTVGTEKLGTHPWKQYRPLADKFAHWSLSFEGGFDLIDADFQQKRNTILPETRIRPTGAISLEYSFTPTWGLAFEYSYANYGYKYKNWNDYTLMGHMHLGMLQLTYDFIDAWFPRRRTDIFSFYGIVGVGMGWYNYKYYETDGAEPLYPLRDNQNPNGKPKGYAMTGVIGVGAAVEFNVSRGLALGLKGMYHIYTVDDIDGRERGTNNDCMEYVTANIRWKIAGRKRNHLRNYASDDVFLANWSDNNTKKAQKDTLIVLTRDTVVVSRTDTIMVINRDQQQRVTNSMMVTEQRMFVYFDHDKYDLKEQSLNTIQQLADRMLENPDIYVEVTGYCDNTGTEAYNDKLGQRRADAVVNEFVRVYGLSRDRFLPMGKGMISNVRAKYGPNRRVEMLLTTENDLQQRREEWEQSKGKSNSGSPTSQVKTNENGGEYLAYVKSQKDVTTLARLARKYYKNVYCWPYIYAANQDILKSPDIIPEGITIRVPRLTAEQMDINNEASMDTARMLAQEYLKK